MGVGSGYTQKDVQELARILTGVGINMNQATPKLPPKLRALYLSDGLFQFDPRRHDFGEKVFLGHKIAGSGFPEVEQALDILAREPATARHVSQQIAVYFVGDAPPPALVSQMAQTFQRTDGDIASVLQTLFSSPAFDKSLGNVFKDPRHFTVSAVRLTYGDQTISNPAALVRWLDWMGEVPNNHQTPDGYPMTSSAWNGPGQMAVRFDFAHAIGSGGIGLLATGGAPKTPAPPLKPVVNRIGIEGLLSSQTKAALDHAGTPRSWNALFLSSPQFMHR